MRPVSPRQPRRGPRRRRGWLLLVPVLGCLSCSGGGLNPVRGQVLQNNQPVKGAVVTFHPQGADDVKVVRPVGRTGEDGTFTLATGPKEGAAEGEYVVTVICPEEVPRAAGKAFSTEPPDTRDRFRGAYADRRTSTLKAQVKKGSNRLEPFRLK